MTATYHPSGPYLDTAGGWHDSGEYQKYGQFFGGNAVFDLLMLYDSNRSYYDAIDTNSNGIADIVDEALWQARWLAKMVQPNGHVMKQISKRRSGASWVKPENDTDRVIGTSDDRWVEIGDENTPTETVVCASAHQDAPRAGLQGAAHGELRRQGPGHLEPPRRPGDLRRRAQQPGQRGPPYLGGARSVRRLRAAGLLGPGRAEDRRDGQRRHQQSGASTTTLPSRRATNLAVWPGSPATIPSTPKAELARTAVQALMDHYMSLAETPSA